MPIVREGAGRSPGLRTLGGRVRRSHAASMRAPTGELLNALPVRGIVRREPMNEADICSDHPMTFGYDVATTACAVRGAGPDQAGPCTS